MMDLMVIFYLGEVGTRLRDSPMVGFKTFIYKRVLSGSRLLCLPISNLKAPDLMILLGFYYWSLPLFNI